MCMCYVMCAVFTWYTCLSVGARQSMHATLSELREEYGAPPDEEEDDGKCSGY